MFISPDKLRALRTDRGWSQDQLATTCGVSLRTIQRIEKDGKCSADTHNALASALDVSPNTLLPETESSKTKQSATPHEGYLGLSIAFLVLTSLLIVGNSPASFFDPFALIATCSLAFSLTILSSGLSATLQSYRALKLLIKPNSSIDDPHPLIAVLQRTMVHYYSAAVVVTFIHLNTQTMPTEMPQPIHWWLHQMLPLTYCVIITEIVWRPLKAKLTARVSQNIRQG